MGQQMNKSTIHLQRFWISGCVFWKYRGTTDRKVGTEQRGCTGNTRQLSLSGAAAAAAAADDDDDDDYMERMCVSRLQFKKHVLRGSAHCSSPPGPKPMYTLW